MSCWRKYGNFLCSPKGWARCWRTPYVTVVIDPVTSAGVPFYPEHILVHPALQEFPAVCA